MGFDALWHTSTFRGSKNLTASTWAARSSGGLPAETDSPKGRRTGWGVRLGYPNDLWGLSAQLDEFGGALDARLGFLPRPGTRRSKLGVAYQPRPRSAALGWARQFFYEISASQVDDLEGGTESWTLFTAPFKVITRSGESIEVNWEPQFDRLDSDFAPASTSAPNATIPAGSYQFTASRSTPPAIDPGRRAGACGSGSSTTGA